MKKILTLLAASLLVLGLVGCTKNDTPDTPTVEGTVEDFAVEYEMTGTTSSGAPKNDTFIFEGKTTDGIITELNFDIIRNKGLEGEYSKKDIMGYQMNVSDAAVVATEDGFELTNLSMNGYTNDLGQFMFKAVCPELTTESTFKDLAITNFDGSVLEGEAAVALYQAIADEGEIELTEDTLLVDLLAIYGLYADEAIVEGTNRISYAGFNGGRSYGEQIDAIVAHILANNMTLEDVYTMFQTVNQQSTPIEERDVVSGATIAFVGDFQRMVYIAIHGELFQGVTNHTTTDGVTVVEVVTQGYAGEIETHVTFDADKNITAIAVRDANETENVGAVLTAEGSEFLAALVEGQADLTAVDAVSGATVTSDALVKAVTIAIEYVNGLE